MTDTTSTPTTSSTSTETLAPLRGAALEAVLAELAAIPEDEVLNPRVDVPGAVLTVIGAAPEIEVHRPAITAFFGAERASVLDRIEPLASALSLAHAEHVASTGIDLEPLAQALAAERKRLLIDAEVLVERKFLPGKKLDGLIGGQAYKDLFTDVALLVTVFGRNWPKIARHTTVSREDLERAHRMASEFNKLLGRRTQATARASESGRLRARAFTLFFRTYDQVRKLLTYLRWHQADVDQIAPSIYGGRTRSRDDGDVDALGADSLGVTTPTTTPIAPGMPGAEPFSRI